MPEADLSARIVLTTVANPDEAGRMARTLVEDRLPACVTLLPAVESVYRWEGRIESAAETMLLIKTETSRLGALEARLHELHSYETPEFLVLKVEAGGRRYLEWLQARLR
jgi:periplasmic divalent cation tolerance protein